MQTKGSNLFDLRGKLRDVRSYYERVARRANLVRLRRAGLAPESLAVGCKVNVCKEEMDL